MDIAIIGGGGHVGLPLGIVLADTGFSVTLVDKDQERLATIECGELPFKELGGRQLLKKVQANDRLYTTTDIEKVSDCDVIFLLSGRQSMNTIIPKWISY